MDPLVPQLSLCRIPFGETACNSWPVICICTNPLPISLSNTHLVCKEATFRSRIGSLQLPRPRFGPQSQGQLCCLCLAADPVHHRQTKSSSSPWVRCAGSTTPSPQNHPNGSGASLFHSLLHHCFVCWASANLVTSEGSEAQALRLTCSWLWEFYKATLNNMRLLLCEYSRDHHHQEQIFLETKS